jgi:hypothetical protein
VITGKCTCPYQYDERTGGSVRASLDQFCPVHGAKSQAVPHCPTCSCGVPIVQTPEVAAQAALRAVADQPGERHD